MSNLSLLILPKVASERIDIYVKASDGRKELSGKTAQRTKNQVSR